MLAKIYLEFERVLKLDKLEFGKKIKIEGS